MTSVDNGGQFGAILPGSFCPLHGGHVRMRELAEQILGCRTAFELSSINADKSAIDHQEVTRRVRQFANAPHVLTEAPTFAEKAVLFPGCWFVVGADTADRMVRLKYYSHDTLTMYTALETLAELGCRVLVFPRFTGTAGSFPRPVTSSIPIPRRFASLFVQVPRSRFEMDISSSRLRDTPEDPNGVSGM